MLEVGEPVGERLGRGPDREDHGQARPLEPEAPEVEVRRRILERALQRGVADQERRVRVHPQGQDLRLREQDADEDDRGRALRRHRDRSDLTEGQAGHELDRVDGALGGDAEPREDPQPVVVSRVLDGRDRCDVDLPVEQHPVELGGDADDLLDLGLETVEDGRHVHVADAAEADHRRSFRRRTSQVATARATSPPQTTRASGETSTVVSSEPK